MAIHDTRLSADSPLGERVYSTLAQVGAGVGGATTVVLVAFMWWLSAVLSHPGGLVVFVVVVSLLSVGALVWLLLGGRSRGLFGVAFALSGVLTLMVGGLVLFGLSAATGAVTDLVHWRP